MPKQKQKLFLKPQKSKRAQTAPETADEFLAAGVDHEEAGEKWRAGDAAKASRFFARAIETYDVGLAKFPKSFDLAYNKWSSYELSEQPRLLRHLPTPLLQLLHVALESHRYALELKSDDSDTLLHVFHLKFKLFSNAAQVLTSLAEALLEGPSTAASPDGRADAISLLQEAINGFEKCLLIQQTQLEETQAQVQSISNDLAAVPQHPNDPPLPATPPAEAQEPAQWASVFEPLTRTALLETCLAEAHALSTLLPLLPTDPVAYQTLATHSETLLSKAQHFAVLATNHDHEQQQKGEAPSTPALTLNATADPNEPPAPLLLAQSRLNLVSSLSSLAYHSGIIDPATYLSNITTTFSSATPSLETYGSGLADYADALITFNSALSPTSPLPPPSVSSSLSNSSPSTELLALRWTALSNALAALSSANTNPGPASRTAINGRRGDVELLRARLAESGYEPAAKNRARLLRNGETYYEGARKLAGAGGDVEGEQGWRGRVSVVRRLREGQGLGATGGMLEEEEQLLVGEMREEGLL
ncbi:MAG: hypothetical protein LQ340_007893 [Diploschistes diacapsis]|nr:MAG: hypothetical protein LQ340_007893 [Diploschistes diacapsis]